MKRILLSVGILITFVVVSLVVGYSFRVPSATSLDRLEVNSGGDPNGYPDIYVIIPDGYPGSRTLINYFGYDNDKFYKELESRGFYVVEESYSSYPKTILTLTSLYNYDYLVLDEYGYFPDDMELELNSKEIEYLKEKGYLTIQVGSGWAGIKPNPYVDLRIGFSRDIADFYAGKIDYEKWVLSQFEEIVKIPFIDAPTYTRMHTLGIHSPYIFSSNPIVHWYDTEAWGATVAEQLEGTNRLLLGAVDSIIKDSSVPPIITIVSDHGLVHPGNTESPVGGIEVGLNNFQAYYMPGLSVGQMSEFGNLVNTFRLVFNFYFGESYELLPQKYYWLEEGWNTPPYKVVDVTDVILGIRGSDER